MNNNCGNAYEKQNQIDEKGEQMKFTEEVVKGLNEKFDKKDIKARQGSFGKTLSYLEGHTVINRLNKVLGNDWSFEIVNQTIYEGHLVIHTRIVVNTNDGTPPVIKEAYGGKKLTKTKQGELLDVASDFKAASTDALKKCASLLGVGLDLYGSDLEDDDKDEKVTPAVAEKPDTGSDPATPEQLSAIAKISKAKKLEVAKAYELAGINLNGTQTPTQDQAKKVIVNLQTVKA